MKETEYNCHQGRQSGCNAGDCIRPDQAAAEDPRLRGVDTKKLYFVDGNTSDYSSELDAGLLEGSKGTIPGVNPSDDFVKRLESTGVDLKNTTTYGAETYDGIILAALAAQKGGSADGKTIQANIPSMRYRMQRKSGP